MKVLFQGDSVTDAGRDRSNPHDMGVGYPKYASAMLSDAYPEIDFEFVNLGISGNRTENLVERLQRDFIDVQPDIVTIMIGINDVWHHFDFNIETTPEKFEQNLRTVLSAIKEKTSAKILLIEPYLLPDPEKAKMLPELEEKIRIERKLAHEYADAYLPLDGIFAAATVRTDYHEFSPDGVHPNADGACFIAEQLLGALAPLLTESSDGADA